MRKPEHDQILSRDIEFVFEVFERKEKHSIEQGVVFGHGQARNRFILGMARANKKM